jgi:carboxymethylenebutenolidase
MKLTAAQVDLPGSHLGHLVRPARVDAPLPGVVLIQEIWGVDEHIQDVAARLATSGYAVLAPALFSRGGGYPAALDPERVQRAKRFLDTVPPQAWAGLPDATARAGMLASLAAPERQALDETLGAIFPANRAAQLDAWAGDLVQAAEWLRRSPAVQGRRVGAIGFCMGGGLAARLATDDPALAAAVVFYGAPPPAERLASLACPILGEFGAEDTRLVQQLPAFEQAMKAAGKSLELHVHAGGPHAFFNDTRASYRVEPAREAWAQTLAFLARHLAASS